MSLFRCTLSEGGRIVLTPYYSGSAGDLATFEATPAGRIEIAPIKANVRPAFKVGNVYDVKFTDAVPLAEKDAEGNDRFEGGALIDLPEEPPAEPPAAEPPAAEPPA